MVWLVYNGLSHAPLPAKTLKQPSSNLNRRHFPPHTHFLNPHDPWPGPDSFILPSREFACNFAFFSTSSSSSFALFLIESALKIFRCVGVFNGLQMRFNVAKGRRRRELPLSIRFLQFVFNFALSEHLLMRMKMYSIFNLVNFNWKSSFLE